MMKSLLRVLPTNSNSLYLIFSVLLLTQQVLLESVHGFTIVTTTKKTTTNQPLQSNHASLLLFASSSSSNNNKEETQTLGLLTFDLDDTLYPIAPVEAAANEALVKSMEQYGFEGLEPDDIVKACKAIRDEMGKQDPQKAAALTYAEVRELAIRQEMEKVVTKNKLIACADDWATPVESLSSLVVANAKK